MRLTTHLAIKGIALVAACAAAVAQAAAAQDPGPALGLSPGADAAMRSIDAERIRAHVRFLSDDLLEGRGTGTRGGDLAAKYIATCFALDGLKPAGDGGGYLQKVEFRGVQTLGGTSFSLHPEHGNALELKLGEDFVTNNQTQTESVDIDAPIVFVGYGIEAPEYHWNDYQGVDVRGKVVLLFVNEPPSKDPKFFGGEAMTYYGRWTYKFEEAARKGAVGALIIHRTDLASYGWPVVKNSWSAEQVYLAGDRDPKLESAAWIQLDVARKLFEASGLKLDDMLAAAGTRGFKARPLPVRFKAHLVSKVRKFESYNVVGLLPGASGGDAQAVIYSAHYDHLGIDPTLSGHQIYNGAVDNATGVGMLLELAHAFATSAARPPHPVVFASVTAEEKGLLGSNYLGKHLPIPAQRIALGLNFDAVPPIGIPESVSVTGAERTTFYPTVEKTAKAFGFEIQADPEPGAGHYYRSDHFSLARAGVPAFSVNTGSKFAGHPPAWGKTEAEDYTAKRYHSPADQYSPSMDFRSNAILARFGFALGWQALTGPGTVNWQPGDEFEAVRVRGGQTK
ncbi:MAG TPA: M28 family metallopeptidase [Steroidobacteraceae bacterium]|jgi:Zn-dependent M28 family amino/carboxypeptidase|nr:M28 family metallopeptidase [Steroidobacteraceae bacterium]